MNEPSPCLRLLVQRLAFPKWRHPNRAFIGCVFAMMFAVRADCEFVQIESLSQAFPKGDIVGVSENGRYRLSVSALPGLVFVYKLTDRVGNRMLWRQKHGDANDLNYWQSAFISNDGWCICEDDNLADVIAPTGRCALSFRFDWPPAISKADNKRYIPIIEDGPISWGEEYSCTHFTEFNGREYFCVRYWWGHHAVVDLAAGRMASVNSTMMRQIDAEEREMVLRQLAQCVRRLPELRADIAKDDCCTDLAADTERASLLPGQLHIREAIPLLRQIEPLAYSAEGVSSPEMDSGKGKADISSWEVYELRQNTQLSLRRLGALPAPYPEITFHQRNHERPYRPRPFPQQRSDRTGLVAKGQAPEQVLDEIGNPDFVDDGTTWEYDMDAPRPYTLRVVWKDRQVAAVKRISPALWQRGVVRDQEIAGQ